MRDMDRAHYLHVAAAMRKRPCVVFEDLWRDAMAQRRELPETSAVPSWTRHSPITRRHLLSNSLLDGKAPTTLAS